MEPGARADITFLFYFLNQEQGRKSEEGKRRRGETEQIRGYSPTLATVPRQTLPGAHAPGISREAVWADQPWEGQDALRPAFSCLLLVSLSHGAPAPPSRLVVRSPLLGKPGQLRAQPGPEQERHLPHQKAIWAAEAAGLYPEGEIPALSTRGQDEQRGRCSEPRIGTQCGSEPGPGFQGLPLGGRAFTLNSSNNNTPFYTETFKRSQLICILVS